MNNAIIALTRGYDNLNQYESLIKRNRRIFQFINRDRKYPLVLFHEGNITEGQQQYIKDRGEGQDIRFIDISEIWYGGYEAMCQFQTYHVWNYCRDLGFDYVLRIDEDCHIVKCDKDPFSYIGENVYMKPCYWAESHSETNATLPQKVQELTGEDPEVFYNHKFPYTNVSIASVKFMQDHINFLFMVGMSPDQRINRWGDLPVIGCLLNIYAKGKVGTMEGFSYEHLSHDNIINSHD